MSPDRSADITKKHTVFNVIRSERSNELDESQSQRSEKVDEEYMQLKVVSRSIDLTPVDKKAFPPTICQQRQAAIDNISYRRAIDQWQPKSFEQLIGFIKSLSVNKNEIDKAWIIFYWISQNIRYDTKAYFDNNIGSQASTNVFLSRKAVCEGYSTLYADLCSRTGLQCRKVSGYAKGYSFNLRQTNFEKTNHAWNILSLKNGHSYFIESTWGSGYLDASTHQYKAKLAPYYFFCRSEHMIYGHFPEDPQWQLLEHQLTMKQYLMLPHTHGEFFELNLNIVSPAYTRNIILETGQSYGEVLIATPINDVELSGSLRDESNTKIEGGDFVYFDHDRNLWRCRFAPQKAGNHTIVIFGRKKSNANKSTLSCAVEFTFDIDHLPTMPISYPITWSKFFDYHLEIVKPVNTRYIDWPLDKNFPYCEILVRSPDDVYLSAAMADGITGKKIENGTLVNFNSQESLWQCLFALPTSDTSYKLTLFAQHITENQSHCVAQFHLQQVHKLILQNYRRFPTTYGSFHEAKCYLFEPLEGILEQQSKIRFHCRIPGAHEVNITVDGQLVKNDSALYMNENYIFQREIQVGQKEVAVWVKFDKQTSNYTRLLEYSVK
ncbi:unnamed protein product [Rotaria sordida]|uniref:Transglutaminase-like domain-containing protein n=1 Tax=Rotaria sordida TaxID=392033 RepID=A0A819E464_9BILA|nr:unnamed protein product [Rotaria sordida]